MVRTTALAFLSSNFVASLGSNLNRYVSILNGGSTAGLISFVWFIVLYLFMGNEYELLSTPDALMRESFTIRIHPYGSIRMLGVIIPALFMFRSMSKFKRDEGEGFLTYGRGFQLGVMFTFVYASLTAMLVFLFGTIVDSSFVDFANEHDLRLVKMTQEIGQFTFIDLEAQIEMIELRDLGDFALTDFWQKTTSGFIIALIVAAFVKQKPPTFAADE